VGLLVSITTLTDWFASKTTHPPPKQIDTRIVWAKPEGVSVTLADYLKDNGKSPAGLSREQAREEGLTFAVRVRLKGNLGMPIPLRWRMFQRNGHALADPLYRQTAGRLTPAAQDHARTVELWLPYPPVPGRYFVEFSLLDNKGQPLDVKTAPFAVTHIPKVD
jgi:hypothetical protein